MDIHTLNYIKHIDPSIEECDVAEARMVNDYELFVKLKNGEKYMYDTFHNNFRGFYPDNYELTDEEWNMSFRLRLRRIMSRKRVSQEELADRLGVSRRTVNRYVNGESIPSCLLLKKISLALNCSVEDFFYKEY